MSERDKPDAPGLVAALEDKAPTDAPAAPGAVPDRERIEREAAQLKAAKPDFDIARELRAPGTGKRFAALLKLGWSLKDAYGAVHINDILDTAVQRTAHRVREQTLMDVRARERRPEENGTGSQAAGVVTRKSVSDWSRSDRDEIARRVQRGEKIRL